MTDFLRTLLGVSVTGGIFILAAILLRAGVRSRMPKHFLVLLWAAVLAHLLLLVGTPSPTSIYNYITFHRPPALEQALYLEEASFHEPNGLEGMAAGRGATGQGGAADSSGWPAALMIVWLSGAGILSVGFAFCYWTTRRRFDDAILLKNDTAVERWLQKRKRPVKVYVSDRTTTPLSYGLLRPRIILPLDFARNNPAQVEGVLEHEYVHCSHYHNVVKFLAGIAVIVHWFNPLVWLYWLLLNHDLELACDEQVLRRLGAGRKAEYAHSLVAVAEKVVTPLPLVSAFNARNLRERIVDVMGFRQSSGIWLVPELLVVACMFALFGTAPAVGASSTRMPGMANEAVALAIPPEFSDWTYPEGADPLSVALSISGGGTVVKHETENKHGRRTAEFKILSASSEYTIKLDVDRRSMLKYERKEKPNRMTGEEVGELISMSRARQFAADAVDGGESVGIELKRTKTGRFLYEVKVLSAGRKYEIDVDASTGRVLDIDD